MIGLGESTLQIGVVALLAWEHVRSQRSAGLPLLGGEHDAFVRAAGIVDEAGAVDPSWVRAIDVANRPSGGLVLVAAEGGVAFLSNVYVRGDDLVVARARAVTVGSVVSRMEPVVEIVMASLAEAWKAIARVLPAVLTGEPDPAATAPVDVPKPPPGMADLRAIIEWEGAPDALRRAAEAALSPDATLSVAWGGAETGSALWVCRDGALFRTDALRWQQMGQAELASDVTGLLTRLAAGS